MCCRREDEAAVAVVVQGEDVVEEVAGKAEGYGYSSPSSVSSPSWPAGERVFLGEVMDMAATWEDLRESDSNSSRGDTTRRVLVEMEWVGEVKTRGSVKWFAAIVEEFAGVRAEGDFVVEGTEEEWGRKE
jgi:hypothetical protein